MSPSSEVSKAGKLATNIMCHLTSAKYILDDVSGRIAALKKSDMIVTLNRTASATDAGLDVSRNRSFVHMMCCLVNFMLVYDLQLY